MTRITNYPLGSSPVTIFRYGSMDQMPWQPRIILAMTAGFVPVFHYIFYPFPCRWKRSAKVSTGLLLNFADHTLIHNNAYHMYIYIYTVFTFYKRAIRPGAKSCSYNIYQQKYIHIMCDVPSTQKDTEVSQVSLIFFRVGIVSHHLVSPMSQLTTAWSASLDS